MTGVQQEAPGVARADRDPLGPPGSPAHLVQVPRQRGLRGLRVAVVADQKLTGQTVAEALSASGFCSTTFAVPRQVSGVRELKERMVRHRIEAALLLHECSDWVSVSQAVRAIREIRVVAWFLLTASEDPAVRGAALEAGAAGAGPIEVSIDEVTCTLAGLAAGADLTPGPERARLLELWAAQREVTDRFDRLTLREREVLEHLRQGRGVVEIATVSFVSIGTVRSQVSAILAKLEVPSQIAAVALLDRASGAISAWW